MLQGVLTFGRGDKYDGEWQDNLPSGEGTFISSSGLAYKGGWLKGQPHGHGILVSPNGRRFAGEFRNGGKEGEGKIDYATGEFYIGQWKGDKVCSEWVVATRALLLAVLPPTRPNTCDRLWAYLIETRETCGCSAMDLASSIHWSKACTKASG
jgi:hypothetical protein